MKKTSLLLTAFASCLVLSACSYSSKSNENMTPTVDNGTYKATDASQSSETTTATTPNITADEALGIALEYVKLTKDEVSVTENFLDYEDGILVHDIDFISGNTEYSFHIDAHSGEIVEHDRDNKTK